MEFCDLKTQYQRISRDLNERLSKVLSQTQFILGPEVEELERSLTSFVGTSYAVTCANGTDALQIALMALGLEPEDEVITTPFTFIATVETILLLRAKPVFVDIDPLTYTIDAHQIEQAITPRTRVVLPISLYGQCADMDLINEIAKRHQLTVLEDGAQSFGATYKGKRSCGISAVASTSFFPSKPLGCYGDGGALFTNDEVLAQQMRQIRAHGQDRRYHHIRVGVNSRLDTLQAAVLLSKLTLFEEEIKLRQKIAGFYSGLLKNMVPIPFVREMNTSVYAQYTIRVPARDKVIQELRSKGIPTAVHYPLALHHQPLLKGRYSSQSFIHAEKAAKEVLSLPMHPYLTEEEQAKVVEALKVALGA